MRLSQMLFTNTPMEELEDEVPSIFDTDNELICHICSSGFSFLNQKYNCCFCHLPICLKDSTYHNESSRVCDSCQREIFVEEIRNEKKLFKQKIIQNIQDALKENTEKNKQIEEESSKIEVLKSRIQDFQKKKEEEIKVLQRSVEELEKVNNDVEVNIKAMSNEAEKRENSEKIMTEKLLKSEQDFNIGKIEIEELLDEKSSIEKQIDKEDTSETQEYSKNIGKELCSKCKKKSNPETRPQDFSNKICSCINF